MRTGRKRLAVCILLSALVLVGILRFRTVASMDGIDLHYQGKVYEECYEVFGFHRGRRLGTVDFGTSRCGLYALQGLPEYLYVSMGLGPDHRIYRLTE